VTCNQTCTVNAEGHQEMRLAQDITRSVNCKKDGNESTTQVRLSQIVNEIKLVGSASASSGYRSINQPPSDLEGTVRLTGKLYFSSMFDRIQCSLSVSKATLRSSIVLRSTFLRLLSRCRTLRCPDSRLIVESENSAPVMFLKSNAWFSDSKRTANARVGMMEASARRNFVSPI